MPLNEDGHGGTRDESQMVIPFDRVKVSVDNPADFWVRLLQEARSQDIAVIGNSQRFRLEPRFRQRVFYRPSVAGEVRADAGSATVVARASTSLFEAAVVPVLLIGACLEAFRDGMWWPPLAFGAAYHAAGMFSGFSPGVARARKAMQEAARRASSLGPSIRENERAAEQAEA